MNQFKSAKVAYVIFSLIIFALVCNILYIGVTGRHFLSGNEIEVFAKSRGTKKDVDSATRGEIYSSDGEVLATSVKKYRLIIYLSTERPGPNAYVEDIALTANTLAPLLNMDATEMAAKMQASKDNGGYQIEFGNNTNKLTSVVKEKIDETELPGLEWEEFTDRNYPMGNFASYIIGYAQIQEEKGLRKVIGKMGFEMVYDEELAGEDGYTIRQVDTKGNTLPNGVLEEKAAENGNDIYLTINSDLQRDLDIQLAKVAQEVGAGVATAGIMEAKTGKILAVSNYPSFDPNSRDIEDYNDFFLNSPYECGSVFKPFVYANAINDGTYPYGQTFQSGTYDVSHGNVIRDWNQGKGFGVISYDHGLAYSSNVGIANLMDHYVDKESIVADFKKLGFFSETAGTVDGLATAAGVAGYDRGRLEFLNSGFGQGSTVTALQLMRAYSVFANNGRTVEPYLVDRIVDPDTNEVVYAGSTEYSEQIFSEDTITKMNELLYNNVYSEQSVAKQYRIETEGMKIMGKTGTGQIAGEGGYRTDIVTKSFAGLAPYDDPEIIIYVLFQCQDQGTTDAIASLVKSMVPSALATKNAYTNSEQDVETTSYTLDSFMNQSTNYAKTKLESKERNVVVIGNGSVVLEQYPNAYTQVNKSDRIFLRTDSNEITIPNMNGWSRKDVLTYSSLSGINIVIEGNIGSVSAQSVAEGTILHPGDTINITLQ